MKIKSIEIKKLFGYLNKKINFYEDISLLVGINGAGKTSILNVINWILTPSINSLCITNFEKIVLEFTSNSKNYKIICSHNGKIFKYEVISDNENFYPLIVNLQHSFKDSSNDIDKIISLYTNLSPDENEAPTWSFIQSLSKPTIIGLDRNLYTETSNEIFLDDSKIRNSKLNSHVINKSPVVKVKELINKEYRIKKNELLKLTNTLKNQIMLSAFEAGVDEESILSDNNYQIHLNQITVAKKRVKDYFENFEKDSFDKNQLAIIDRYFNNLENITKKYQNNSNDNLTKILYNLNANQFSKTITLLKAFEKFEKDSLKALNKINTFIETINHFFKDSNKKMVFKEETSEIFFNTLNSSNEILTEHNDIKFLSSGEEQILVLFTYIAFSEEKNKIFIIDEPELSLHLRWQENFIDQLEKILDVNNQIILATHSPILVSDKKNKAIILLPE